MPDAGMIDELRAMAGTRLREAAIPSVALGIAHRGEILCEEGFGWADRERRIPATGHTSYSIASTTKPFTTTAIMILAERGKLGLDRPINDYLGDARIRARAGSADEATPRRVASHTSGLGSGVRFFYADEPRSVPDPDEVILRYGVLVTDPGERFRYTNLGYGVLTYVIERLSGQRYADFLHREVFLPLGMTRTSVGMRPELTGFAACRYGADGLPIPFYDFDHRGGSAIFSSVHDLLRFGLFHLGTPLRDQKRILSPASVSEMQRSQARVCAGVDYGLGWWIRDDGAGHRTVEHPGGMPGVSTSLLLVPEEQLVVAALSNASSEVPAGMIREVLRMLAPPYAELPSVVELLRQEKPAEPLGPLRGQWTGTIHTHRGDVGLAITFRECGDVIAQIGAGMKTLVNNATVREGVLTGDVPAALDTDDTRGLPHRLALDLRINGERLYGSVDAVSPPDSRWTIGLPHWTELRRNA